ncbi:MAG: ribosome small subunit-dependent GTPase A [Oscillospiraceae bacterium]|nr:ribosome small subunit-dependent GTPase A [Oscillospiraceae bacterium]
MPQGRIMKALSGFYYVRWEQGTAACRARGKFRAEGVTPLVGDFVAFEPEANGSGTVTEVLPRKNRFLRPAVANVDALVLLCANVNPVTDPFLVDRVAVIAEHVGCGVLICINKCDLDPGDELWNAFTRNTGYPVLRTSAVTGEGVEELTGLIRGRTVAFTGNSGVGKSSLLKCIAPSLEVQVGEVSRALGRGRHTTRHIELYDAGEDTLIADTPGFSSFDLSRMPPIPKEELQRCFPEFLPYLGRCRFDDCAHLKEPGCAVLDALRAGNIAPSRHRSYVRLREAAGQLKAWEQK